MFSFLKNEKITLILQPMTHPEVLAYYLADNGFDVVDESVVCENGRTDRAYRIIKAVYSGKTRRIDAVDAYVGRINLERGDGDSMTYARRTLYFLQNKIDGKRRSGADVSCDVKVVEEIEKYIK